LLRKLLGESVFVACIVLLRFDVLRERPTLFRKIVQSSLKEW
jgi:hypothetical protein